jgi:hypothetical protein
MRSIPAKSIGGMGIALAPRAMEPPRPARQHSPYRAIQGTMFIFLGLAMGFWYFAECFRAYQIATDAAKSPIAKSGQYHL